MAAKLGLPDDEIDRLLSEAEARLSGSGNGTSDAVAAAPAVKAPATIVAAPVAAAAGEPAAEPNKKSEKLSTKDTLGSDWYNLPRTNLTPELKRDLQILRMRDVVAMGKQFFKKDSRKDFIPEYSQVGTIIAGATDGVSGRLTRKERKRTIVEEVLSGENTNKFKSKYLEIQVQKRSGKKSHYKKLVAARRKRNG
ncbi:c68c5821-4c99-4cc9-a188-869ba3261346 [Thermothielavioides terrestris]|uniref:C68c5821-4c99-4cc9-a188-869ba3261346 n=1 Tax=Thermothielavioides terrestris TaxID=2587410 RepID=A0A446BJQ6_9PEZI|nr:c68c5821-4c99-4cc9-a188-869ba3261346 [Thermothielavioides terrestris]